MTITGLLGCVGLTVEGLHVGHIEVSSQFSPTETTSPNSWDTGYQYCTYAYHNVRDVILSTHNFGMMKMWDVGY